MIHKKPSRREVLLATAATGLVAGSGISAFAEDKPDVPLPQGKAGKLTVIHRTEFFAEAQTAFRTALEDFSKANNIELDASTTDPNVFGDFLGKMTAAVRAGNPPDLAYHGISVPQMHTLDLCEDVTDVVEEAIGKYGYVMPGASPEKNGKFDGRWASIPFIARADGCFFRGDKLKEKGIDPASLTTYDARREAALAISDPNNNFWGWGITCNKSGDGENFVMSVINDFGGHYTDPTGQIVQFNSPETVAAVAWIKETYDRNGKYAAMLPPGVEGWGDTGNNEAYVAGSVGFTRNAYSVYAKAKQDAPDIYKNTVVLHEATATNGDNRDLGYMGGWLTIFKGAPNKDVAKKLALYLLDPANFNKIASVSGGLIMPAYNDLWTPELIGADPNFKIIKEVLDVKTPFVGTSWPASPSAAIGAIGGQAVATTMMAYVNSGQMTPAEAVKDAHNKIVKIFESGGMKQPN